FTPDSLEVTAEVTLESGTITESHLTLKAKIPGISAEKFKESAEDAKANCPISKLLNTNKTMDASLV
ncbi:MAG TPA: OsmC family protein, partial [Puia sp.]|nr:OsmC family protein [Puia sp.]